MRKMMILCLVAIFAMSLTLQGCGSKNELSDAEMAQYTQMRADQAAKVEAEWLKTDEEGNDAVRDINLIPKNDYQAWLAIQSQANKNNSVTTFEMSGVTSITGNNITIVKRDVVTPVTVERPKTWKDVVDHAIDPLFSVAALGLKVWGVLEFTDTIVDGINEDPLVVEQDKIEVVEVPEIEVVEIPDPYEVPGDPIIIEQPVIVEVPTPWVPPVPEGPIEFVGTIDIPNPITVTPAP
jgi:outer membrane lipoprotein-sorting protein